MASLALFYHPSAGITQSTNKSFGIDTANVNKFRISSIFNVTGSVQAYAMVSGTILLQQQTGVPAKVNLILKPHNQDNLKLPVKYIVYRGLQTSDFIDNNDLTDPNNKVKTYGSELLDTMQAIQQQRAPADDIPIEALFGNDLAPLSTKSIDEFFFQNLAVASQLFTIDCGIDLGKFATGEIGIEVILENPEYFLTVEDAKKPLHEINVAGLSSAEKKFKQDLVRHFVDPAAYYGLHHDIKGGIEYRNTSGKQNANTAALVYSQIVDKFLTKNKVYLDVRNENGYSYNYYGNYVGTGVDANKNIKIGQTANTLVAKEYYTSGWAIHTIDVTAGSGSENEIFVALRIDDNKRPLIAGWSYTLLNTSGTGTIVPDENVYFADEIVLLGSPIPNPLPDFTNAISFKVPNVTGGTSNQLATIVKWDYIKQLLPLTNSNKFPRINFTDYIFGPLNVTLPWDIDDKIEWITTNHRTYIDTTCEGYLLGQYKTTILSIDLGSNEIEIFDEVPVELSKEVIIGFVNSNPQQKYTPVSITYDNGKTKIKVAETISSPLQTGDQLTLTVRLDGTLDYENNKFIIKGENYVNLEVLSTGNQLYFYSIAFLNTYDISTVVYNNSNTEVSFSNSKPKAGIAGFVETGILLEDDVTNTGNSDNDRVLFYAMPTNVYINKARNKKSKFQKKGGTLNKSFADALKILLPDVEFEKTVLDITPEPVNIFSLSSKDKVQETLFLLGLTRVEWDIAKVAVTTNFHQQFFKLLSTTDSKTDNDSNNYYEYELQVAGEDTNGDFQVVNTGIKVYSIDRLVYVTAEFGKRADIDTTLAMQILEDFIEQTLYHDGKDFESEYKRPKFLKYKSFGRGNFRFYFSDEENINISSNSFWKTYTGGRNNKDLFLLDKDSLNPPEIPLNLQSLITTNPHTEKSFREKIESFKQAIDNVESNKAKIEILLMEKGADILQFAKWRIQETGENWTNKDGMLYLARLIMSIIIRNHPKIMKLFGSGSSQLQKLLDTFEKHSRGLEGSEKPTFSSQTTTEFNILISGFDPFGSAYPNTYYDWENYQSNPSGNLALSLDGANKTNPINGKTVTIKSVIFPVRFKEFDDNWVESFFKSYIEDDNVKMIITFSYGIESTRYDFEIERFAANNRGGSTTTTDNDKKEFSKDKTIFKKNKTAPIEFLESTLPINQMFILNKVGLDQKAVLDFYKNGKLVVRKSYINNTETNDIINRDKNPFTGHTDRLVQIFNNDLKASYKDNPIKEINLDNYSPTGIGPSGDVADEIRAVDGSGGNYLSNEIFYRVTFLRNQLKPDKITGHIHVGYLKEPYSILGVRKPPVTVNVDRVDMLNQILISISNATSIF